MYFVDKIIKTIEIFSLDVNVMLMLENLFTFAFPYIILFEQIVVLPA